MLVIGVGASFAAQAANLFEVYHDALAHDARYAAARAQREADQEKVVQGRAALLPTLTATANTRWNDIDTRTGAGLDSDAKYNSNGYALQLTQPLFRRQNWIQYEVGALQTELAESQFGDATQALILRASTAYFDVLNARDALGAVTRLRTAAAEQLELARTSFEVGTVTITDVHEAQSRFDLAVAQEIAAQNALDVANQGLARLIGHAPGTLAGLLPGVALQAPSPSDIEPWVAAAMESDYGVRAAELGHEIAARTLDSVQSGHLPTLDIVASFGRNRRSSPSIEHSDSGVIGLEFNVPLYQGGAVRSAAREAAALKLKAEAELDEARRVAALTAREAYLGVTSGMAQVKALEAAQVSSASALEANRLGYEVGVRINIDVLNAQSQLADTQQKLARARYDTLLAQLRLKAAAGALSEDDVRAINALLEPQSLPTTRDNTLDE
ncbi:outer membrane protein [Betaproteobacteria bacterium]|nr:outer membrane protein [Betaproteobacteria bacterium]